MEYDIGYLVTPIIVGVRVIPEEKRVTTFVPLEEMPAVARAYHEAQVIYEMKRIGDWLNGK